MLKRNKYQEYFFRHTYKIDWTYQPKLHSKCNKNPSTAFLNLTFYRARSPQPPLREGDPPSPLVLSPSRAFGTRGTLSASHGWTTFQKPATALSLVWLWKIDKKAMIRSRYNRVPHPAPNTKRDKHNQDGSVRVAERLALPTSDHGVAGSNPAGGEILPEPKRRFIAQSLSCSPFHRLQMTEILLKGRKTLTHLYNQDGI